jgi:hypothetical protein
MVDDALARRLDAILLLLGANVCLLGGLVFGRGVRDEANLAKIALVVFAMVVGGVWAVRATAERD